MFDQIKAYFNGFAANRKRDGPRASVIPIGRGRRVTVDANGDAVYSTCIETLARQIAQTRWGLYGKDHQEITRLMAELEEVLNLQPYTGINAYSFWEYMEKQRLGCGNAFAYICCDALGALTALVPLDAARVCMYWDDANILDGARRIVYEYTDPVTSRTYTILPEEMLHVKAYSANGLVGRSALEVIRSTLDGNAEVESALRTSVENGFSGTIVLSYTSDLSVSKQKVLQKQVKELLSNTDSTILPLPAGMSASNISNNIKDYFDTLKTINTQEISSFFGIPLFMLNVVGGAGTATFSTTQMTSFYNNTIAPIVNQYALELTIKLLTRRQRQKGFRFDICNNVFDFLDAGAKASVLCAYTGAGILTPNEARISLSYPESDDPAADKLSQRGGTGLLGDSATNEGGEGKTDDS